MMYSVRLGRRWLALSAALLASTTSGFTQQPPNVIPNAAASPADDFMRRQAEQDLEQRLRALGDATPREVAPNAPEQVGPTTDAAKGPCFAITRVEVEGVTLLSSQTLAPQLASYQNKCIGLADINVLLKDITSLYMDAGYITSRVYVPEQDIAKTKVLRLVAAEGSLSDIYLNGKPAEYPGLIATAFPGLKENLSISAMLNKGLIRSIACLLTMPRPRCCRARSPGHLFSMSRMSRVCRGIFPSRTTI